MPKKLQRFRKEAIFGGVCAGLSYRTGMPLWSMRMLWAFAIFCYGVGLIPYLFLCIYMPGTDDTPSDYESRVSDPDGEDFA